MLIFVDLLVNFIDYYSAVDHKDLIDLLSYSSGLAASFTVFLLAGKLDSKWLNLDWACIPLIGKYSMPIIILYLYGAIQPLFFIFDYSDSTEYAKLVLMFLSCILKFGLLIFFYQLLKSNKLLFYLYELNYLFNNEKNEFEQICNLRDSLIKNYDNKNKKRKVDKKEGEKRKLKESIPCKGKSDNGKGKVCKRRTKNENGYCDSHQEQL